MSENKDIEQIAELLFGLRKYSQEELCCVLELMYIFGKADSDEKTKMLVRAAELGYKVRHKMETITSSGMETTLQTEHQIKKI